MDHMFIMRLAALLFGGGIAGCLFPGKSRMSHILFLLLILAETAVAQSGKVPEGAIGPSLSLIKSFLALIALL